MSGYGDITNPNTYQSNDGHGSREYENAIFLAIFSAIC
uniref:Uncharacterized protein n=1 Tax=mine drainage metagenome TaxID=410659 RepID=E6Q0L2_9ZZZZ